MVVRGRGREWADQHFLTSGFVGHVGHPPSVRRELCLLRILGDTVVSIATRPTSPRVTRFTLSPTGVGRLSIDPVQRDLTALPDGSRVVYVGLGPQGSALFGRALDQLEPTLLVGNGVPRAPFPSPDGQWVGFVDIAGGTPVLKKVAVTGGSAQTLCAVDGLGYGAAWADDGSIIFATVNPATGLQRVSSASGTPVVLTTPAGTAGSRRRREACAVSMRPHMLAETVAVVCSVVNTTISRSVGGGVRLALGAYRANPSQNL